MSHPSPGLLPDMSPESEHSRKRRVGKACDLCRIKKTKCDGMKPCSRCTADNKICIYTERKKPTNKAYPPGYVELLETRIDLLLKLLDKVVRLALEGENLLFLLHDGQLSVNDVILLLIHKKGLLDHQPLDWVAGTLIAAKVTPLDPRLLLEAAAMFHEHNENLGSAASSLRSASSAAGTPPVRLRQLSGPFIHAKPLPLPHLRASLLRVSTQTKSSGKSHVGREPVPEEAPQDMMLQDMVPQELADLETLGSGDLLFFGRSPGDTPIDAQQQWVEDYYGMSSVAEPYGSVFGFNGGMDDAPPSDLAGMDRTLLTLPTLGFGSGYERPLAVFLANAGRGGAFLLLDFSSNSGTLLFLDLVDPHQLQDPGVVPYSKLLPRELAFSKHVAKPAHSRSNLHLSQRTDFALLSTLDMAMLKSEPLLPVT